VQTTNSILPKNLLSIFDYPIQHYDIEVFLYQDHGEEVEGKNKKLKRRQGDEGKNKKIKRREPKSRR
jgi:hypothetical protein